VILSVVMNMSEEPAASTSRVETNVLRISSVIQSTSNYLSFYFVIISSHTRKALNNYCRQARSFTHFVLRLSSYHTHIIYTIISF
jgi:hypothetical protein